MTRDKFDNLLAGKLGGAHVDPPDGMWERIAATLDEQRLSAQEPAPARHGMTIRKPRRMRFGWAAVAAVLLCVVVFSLNEFVRVPQSDDPVAHGSEPADDPTILTPDQIGDLITATTGRPEAVQIPEIILSHIAIVDDARFEPFDQTPEEVAITFETYTIENDKTPATTSDMGRRRTPADRYEIAEDLVPQRRAAPVGVSVYSSNLGGLTGENVANNMGGAMAAEASAYGANPYTRAVPAYELKHRMPLSGGVSVRKGLTDRLSIESGVTYTYMLAEGEARLATDITLDIEQKLHYVGVPVGLSYDIIRSRNLDLYAGGAALFEICVSSRRTEVLKQAGVTGKPDSGRLNVRGIQPSMGAYIGAEVKLSETLGIYVEPGVTYYFDNHRQPENYRTEHPLGLSLRAGFRVNL